MKKILLLCLVSSLFFSTSSIAQADTMSDKYYQQLKKAVREIVAENSYTRVPSQDFEKTLSQQITMAVNTKFQFLYWIVGVITFLFGSAILFIAKDYIKQSANKSIDEKIAVEMAKTQTSLQNESKLIKADLENKLVEVNQKLENAGSQLTDAKKEILGIRLEKIRTEVDNKNVADETFRSLMSSLKESESLDPRLITKVIDILSTASYYLGRETEMEKVVQTYIHDEAVSLREVVFINLASGFFYNYYSTNDNRDKEKCLSFMNESLRRNSLYGEAFGLKLELLMLTHSRTADAPEKEKLEFEIKEVLQLSLAAASSVIERFERVHVSKIEGMYIDMLYQKFPKEMGEIKDLATKEKKAGE